MFRVATGYMKLFMKIDNTLTKEDYEELKRLCAVCKNSARCKDHSKYCVAKWGAVKVARIKYARDLRKGGNQHG